MNNNKINYLFKKYNVEKFDRVNNNCQCILCSKTEINNLNCNSCLYLYKNYLFCREHIIFLLRQKEENFFELYN